MTNFEKWMNQKHPEYISEAWHSLMGKPVPLKPGEEHCPYCDGYGYLPVGNERGVTQIDPPQCHNCEGSGKKG